MDDKTAIQHLKRGDLAGLDVLVNRYQMKAVRTAYLITQDKHIAEDVMQNAFIRAYERIGQFDLSRPFEPWFMRLVANLSLNAVKSEQRIIQLEPQLEQNLVAKVLNPAHALEKSEREAAIRQALKELPAEQRAVIVLRYYLDYSESEMAQELQAPLGTIRWRLHAARKKLKGLLASFWQSKKVRIVHDE